MSFRLVTSLRKAGEIASALEMARKDYAASVDHYSASALFWTLRAVCETKIGEGDYESANEILSEMQGAFKDMEDDFGIARRCLAHLEISVSPDSAIIYQLYLRAKEGDVDEAYSKIGEIVDFPSFPEKIKNYAAWIVFYYLKVKIEVIQERSFSEAIEKYFSICDAKPSLVHSQILNMAIKFAGLHQDYNLIEFMKRWDVRNFREEDKVRDSDFAKGLSLRDRAVRRCFANRAVMLDDVKDVFKDSPGLAGEDIEELLSRSYSFILYKDSVENKGWTTFAADAQEYVKRIGRSNVLCNQFHSKILESVVWEINDENLLWFKGFFEEWGFGDSFRTEDWEKQKGKDGLKLPSLAERVLGKYADAVERYGVGDSSGRYKALLVSASEKLAETESVLRRLAKIYFIEGNAEEASKITCGLIRTHRVKFYYWSDLASFLPSSDNDLVAACYAKAILSCNEEKYLGKIHLNLARCLLKKNLYEAALSEAEKYKSTCERNGWPVKSAYGDIVSSVPEGTTAKRNDPGFYSRLEAVADEYVYSDLPSHTMVCMGKMSQVNKATGKKRQMFILYDSENTRYLVNPNAFGLSGKADKYSCFDVRYVLDDNGRRKVVSVRPTGKADVLSYASGVVIRTADDGSVDTVLGDGFKVMIPRSDRSFIGCVGQSIEVAINRRTVDGKVVCGCIDIKASDKASNLVGEFRGALRLINMNSKVFGFVEGIYIGKHLLDGFSDGEVVSGISVSENERIYAITLSHSAD